MKVLLIGGTGFIGRSVAERLLADGHVVLGLARNDAAASALRRLGVEPRLVAGGLLGDSAALAGAVHGCSAAIDVAVHNFRDAIPGIKTIRCALGADGIFISTTGTNFYGDSPDSLKEPTREHREFGWRPREPELWPEDLRSMMERMAVWWPKFEAAVLDASDGARRTCIIRPGVVYGRGSGGLGGGPIGFVKRALHLAKAEFVNDGRLGQRSSVHVDDLADLYAIALRSLSSGQLPPGSILNACSCTFTQRDLANAISATCGNLPVAEVTLAEFAKEVGVFAAEEITMIQVADASKAKQLGWTPKHPPLVEDLSTGSYAGIVAKLRSDFIGRSKL